MGIVGSHYVCLQLLEWQYALLEEHVHKHCWLFPRHLQEQSGRDVVVS